MRVDLTDAEVAFLRSALPQVHISNTLERAAEYIRIANGIDAKLQHEQEPPTEVNDEPEAEE